MYVCGEGVGGRGVRVHLKSFFKTVLERADMYFLFQVLCSLHSVLIINHFYIPLPYGMFLTVRLSMKGVKKKKKSLCILQTIPHHLMKFDSEASSAE